MHYIGQKVMHPETGERGVITHHFPGADNPWQVRWDGTMARYPGYYLIITN